MKALQKCVLAMMAWLVVLGCMPAPARAEEDLSGSNWMGSVPTGRYLSDINIPGTHGSALSRVYLDDQTTSTKDAASYVVTQSKTIPQQLADGVRLIELTLTTRKPATGWSNKGDRLWVACTVKAFGSTDLTFYAQDANGNAVSFKRAINYLRSFLKKNPTETVIVAINAEGSDAKTVFAQLSKELDDYAAYLYLGTTMPRLKEARGKVVVCTTNPELVGNRGLAYPLSGKTANVGGVNFSGIDAASSTKAANASSSEKVPTSADAHASASRFVYSAPGFSQQSTPKQAAASINSALYGASGVFAQRGNLYGWSLSDFVDAKDKDATPKTLWMANFTTLRYANLTYKTTLPTEQTWRTDRVIEQGESIVPSYKVTIPGMVFNGWNTKRDGSGTTYQEKDIITLESDLTLWAQWHMSWTSLEDYLDGLVEEEKKEATIDLYSDVTAADFDTCLHIPKGIKVTIRMNGHTLNRARKTPAEDGSVFFVMEEASLALVGPGTITGGNTTGFGGGIRMGPESAIELTDIKISGNKANYGGGISVGAGKSLAMSGDMQITDNYDYSRPGNVYIGSPNRIKLTGPLAKDARIGVRTNYVITARDPYVLSDGLAGRGDVSNFVADDAGVVIRTNKEGEAYLTAPFTVTFETNGGTTKIDSQLVMEGDKVTKPADPARYDATRLKSDELKGKYEFMGWFKDKELTKAWDFQSDVVTGDTTIYAKWGVRVRFDTGEGANLEDKVLEIGSKLSEADCALPRIPGREVARWTYTSGITDDSGKGQLVTLKFGDPIKCSMVLRAQWVDKDCVVTFDSNGGSAVASQKVARSGKVTEPVPEPTKTGYEFKGWFFDEGWKFYRWMFGSSIVKDDMTLHAQWKEREVTVTFDANGGSWSDTVTTAESKLRYGAKVSKRSAPTYEGHIFNGWSTSASEDLPYDFSQPVTSDLRLYANWLEKPVAYLVSFNATGGAPVPSSQSVSSGGVATQPATPPAKEGHTFEGWFVEGTDTAYGFDTPVTSDIALYAKWTPLNRVVHYLVGDAERKTENVPYGSRAPKNDPSAEVGEKLFCGWFTTGECAVPYDFSKPVTDELRLYAKLIDKTPDLYTVVFEANGGAPVPDAQTVASGSTVVRPDDPAKEGFSFGGWYPTADCDTEQWDFATNTVKGNMTLHAKWNANTYEVSFDSQGGTDVASQQISHGQTVMEPADPTMESAVFLGWYVHPSEGGADASHPFDFTTPVTGSLRLYAHWTSLHLVTFDANGGAPAPESQSIVDGEKATEPTAPTKEHYVFGGWYQGESEDGGVVGDAWSFDSPVTADIRLYAKWTPETYVVTFDSAGGSAVETQAVEYGHFAAEPTDPVRDGFFFEGWNVGDDTLYDFLGNAVTADITLTAQWIPAYYGVAFFDDLKGDALLHDHQVVDKGQVAAVPVEPFREGYLFVGWYEQNGEGTLLDVPFDFTTPIERDYLLVAKWSERPPTHTVTFQQGNGTEDTTASVESGELLAEPVDPTFEGHIFQGWYMLLPQGFITDDELRNPEVAECVWRDSNDVLAAYDFSWRVEGDVTLRARWEVMQHAVTFDTGDGTPVAAQTISHGQNATRPQDPVRANYAFKGWLLGGKQYDFATPVTSDLTLRARWKRETTFCRVTYDSNGGTKVAFQNVPYLGKATSPRTPRRKGYTFVGWFVPITDPGVDVDALYAQYPWLKSITLVDAEHGNQVMMGYNFADPVFEDLALRAMWVRNECEVRFHVGDVILEEYTTDVMSGEAVERPEDLYRFGSTFAGWLIAQSKDGLTASADGEEYYDFATPIDSDIDLYASFSTNPYAVTFDSAGGSEVAAQAVPHGEKATRPDDPVYEGHVFTGWYELVAEDVESSDFDDMPKAKESLWFVDGDAYLLFDFDETLVLSDTTLRARWDEARTDESGEQGQGNGGQGVSKASDASNSGSGNGTTASRTVTSSGTSAKTQTPKTRDESPLALPFVLAVGAVLAFASGWKARRRS